MFSCSYGNAQAAQELLRAGANPDILSDDPTAPNRNVTALTIACSLEKGNDAQCAEIVNTLLVYEADVNICG